MKEIYRGRLGKVTVVLAEGDLFAAPVDAIVNSEQSDFVLSANRNTISGQINARYGSTVQKELFSQTAGGVLPAGAVLRTSGGTDFKRIYHAGFHEPSQWRTWSDLQDEDYFELIGRCMGEVLQDTVAEQLERIAFPLIGCGLFGLSEKMLVRQFLHQLQACSARQQDAMPPEVWLVIRDATTTLRVVQEVMDIAFEACQNQPHVAFEMAGVPLLDRFAVSAMNFRDPPWLAWQICRYCEIALEMMLATLATARQPKVEPKQHLQPGQPLTFGRCRTLAHKIRSQHEGRWPDRWSELFAAVLAQRQCQEQLEEVILQRNRLAHGAAPPPPDEIYGMVSSALNLPRWTELAGTEGPPQLSNCPPWMCSPDDEPDREGILTRWNISAFRYLVPETGRIFEKQWGDET